MTPDQLKQDYQELVSMAKSMLGLAHKLGGGFSGIAPLEEALKGVCSLYCLAAFGAEGTGKTTFLQQILGTTWELPEDKQKEGCALWQYSVARWGKTRLDGIVERHADLRLFEEIRVVDSASSSDPLVREQAPIALRMGDVNFWFFSSEDLECESTWSLLRDADLHIYQNSLIIISMFSEESSEDVLERMKQIRKDKLGADLPILLWCKDGEKADVYLEKIGVACEETAYSMEHRDFLRNLLNLQDGLCTEIKTVVSDKDRNMRQDGSFLRQLDVEIDALRVAETEMVESRLKAMGKVAEEFFPQIIETIVKKMGCVPSFIRLFKYRNYPLLLDKWVLGVLSKYLIARLENYDIEYVHKCENHWVSVRPRAIDQLMCDIGEFPMDDMERDLNHYRSGVRRSLEKPIRDFQLRVILFREFKSLEHCMRGYLMGSLLLVILGSMFGILGIDTGGLAMLLLAGLVWLIGVWELYRMKKRFVKDSEYLQDSFVHEFIENGLRPAVLEGALCNVSNYRSKLSQIHGKIFVLKAELEPIQKELDSLQRHLRVKAHKV